jgi:metal-responsive CopG/Arc/MetJ family transcriptional regulator
MLYFNCYEFVAYGEMMSKYIAVNLPEEYIDAVDNARKKTPFIRSRAGFVKRAIEFFLKNQEEVR